MLMYYDDVRKGVLAVFLPPRTHRSADPSHSEGHMRALGGLRSLLPHGFSETDDVMGFPLII